MAIEVTRPLAQIWAEHYTGLNFKILPAGAGDDRKGLFVAHEFATTDDKTIASWWDLYPQAGPAVLCGKDSGVFTLHLNVGPDKDGKNQDGYADWAALRQKHGFVEQGAKFFSPDGGLRLVFKHPKIFKVVSSDGELAPGISVCGDGAADLLPPSMGYKPAAGEDEQYHAWPEDQEEFTPMDPPDWLLEQVCLPWEDDDQPFQTSHDFPGVPVVDIVEDHEEVHEEQSAPAKEAPVVIEVPRSTETTKPTIVGIVEASDDVPAPESAIDGIMDTAPFDYVYRQELVRRHLTFTVGASEAGKSSSAIYKLVQMALHGTKSWMLAEDGTDDVKKKILGTLKALGRTPADISDRMLLNSMRKQKFRLVDGGGNANMDAARVVVRYMKAHGISVLVIDPFIRLLLGFSENDNIKMSAIMEMLIYIAEEANAAVWVLHHATKGATKDQENRPMRIEDGRGAGSIITNARVKQILNPMTEKEAKEAKIPFNKRREYFRMDLHGNLLAPGQKAEWWHLIGVDIGNAKDGRPADNIGVVEPWSWPTAESHLTGALVDKIIYKVSTGEWRESSKCTAAAGSKDLWVGYAIAEVMDLNADNKADRIRIKAMIDHLIQSQHLKLDQSKDYKGNNRTVVIPGIKAN